LFLVVTSELKLATLHELQTIYNTQDFYDLLEIIEVDRELRAIAEARAKMEQANNH
jgi:4-diphosphocytidyl-2C-methyl-D-erythritol kinase